MRMRLEARVEEILGASIHGGKPHSLGPHLFCGVVLAWRRAHLVRRAHHQQGGLSELSLQ
jgi:hypothetical protein